jgi:hypothetical protein
MAEGRMVTLTMYIADDPLEANEGVHASLNAGRRVVTRSYVDPTKTRAQLVTQALTDVRTAILNMD